MQHITQRKSFLPHITADIWCSPIRLWLRWAITSAWSVFKAYFLCCVLRSWKKRGCWTRQRSQREAGNWGEASRGCSCWREKWDSFFQVRWGNYCLNGVHVFVNYRKNWSLSWVVLVGNSLVFFKDPKSQTPSSWVRVSCFFSDGIINSLNKN